MPRIPLLLLFNLSTGEAWPASHAQEHPESQIERSEEGEHTHENALALFLGGTNAKNETHFTAGLEYERELTHRLALQGVAEHLSDPGAFVFLAPIVLRPAGELHVLAGPGFETTSRHVDEHSAGGHGEVEEGNETSFVWRVGAGYKIRVGERTFLLPNMDLDFVRKEGSWEKAFLLGVSVGFGF
jgi:hypothetical protein